MAVQHKDLPESALHEPKGVSTASAGDAYIANGTGSGEWKSLGGQNLVIVNDEDDLPTPVGGVINLEANTTYRVFGTVSVTYPIVAAANTAINGEYANNCVLAYAGTDPFITFSNINFKLSDVSFECPNCTVVSAVDDGTELRVFDVSNVVIQSCVSGYILNGVTIVASVSRVVGYSVAGLRYTGGTDIVAFSLDKMAFFESTPTAVAIDLGSATFQTFELTDGIHGGTGTFLSGLANSGNLSTGSVGSIFGCDLTNSTTPLVGLTVDDTGYVFRDNFPVQDSLPDALIYFTNNATTTSISAGGTFEPVAGTFLTKRISQFEVSGGALTWKGSRPLVVPLTFRCVLSPDSGTNVSVTTALYINGVLDTGSETTVDGVTSADSTSVTTPWQVEFQPDDVVQIYITTDTGADVIVTNAILRTN